MNRLSINTFLSEDFLNDSGFSTVGDVLNLAIVGENEFVDVKAEEVQECCLVVVGSDDVFDGSMTELVGRSVGHARFEAAAGHPDAESLAVVIATVLFRAALVLGDGQSPDFSTPMDDRFVQHTSLFEVGNQCRGRLVCSTAD